MDPFRPPYFGPSLGIIGNRFSSALVNSTGTIEWCALPFLDSPCHFGTLFDRAQGGYFQITPQTDFTSKQQYVARSLVLETQFTTSTGQAVLSDWIVPSENGTGPIHLIREIKTLKGQVDWLAICQPVFNYGEEQAQAELHFRGILFRGASPGNIALLSPDVPMEISTSGHSSAVGKFTTRAEETTRFQWIWGRHSSQNLPIDRDAAVRFWQTQVHTCLNPATSGCLFGGPWHELVSRSGLFLQLLSTPYAGSTSEAAAVFFQNFNPPQSPWGPRLATIRNGLFLMQALYYLGYSTQAREYFLWLEQILIRDGVERLQSHYTLDGGLYQNPQDGFQLDIYGHVLVTTFVAYTLFHEVSPAFWAKLKEIADFICQAWKRPDHGPAGFGMKPEHYLVSKLFCWAGLNSVIQLAKHLKVPVESNWIHERQVLHKTICDQGFDSRLSSFTHAFGSQDLDSSFFWIPILGFLPADDPRVQSSLDQIRSQLTDGPWLLSTHLSSSPEGAAIDPWASLFMVTSLCTMGRLDEAIDRLADICSYLNPLGIFTSTQAQKDSRLATLILSNASHTQLVNAALYIGTWRLLSLKAPDELPLLMGLPSVERLRRIA